MVIGSVWGSAKTVWQSKNFNFFSLNRYILFPKLFPCMNNMLAVVESSSDTRPLLS